MKLPYLRKPKTTQERRMNVAHRCFVRRARFSIPTHWDDISVSTLYDRSWKNYRKKQYKTDGLPQIRINDHVANNLNRYE